MSCINIIKENDRRTIIPVRSQRWGITKARPLCILPTASSGMGPKNQQPKERQAALADSVGLDL